MTEIFHRPAVVRAAHALVGGLRLSRVDRMATLLDRLVDEDTSTQSGDFKPGGQYGLCASAVKSSPLCSQKGRREVKLNDRQCDLLKQVRDATDKVSPLHRGGDVTEPGLVARGGSIRALQRRGLVAFAGAVVEVDGDGYSVTGNQDAPSWTITDAGREALAEGK